MSIKEILRLLVFRYYRRDKLVSMLVVFGIALGLSGYVAIDLANDQAFRAFRISAGRIVGTAVFSISSSGGGVDENLAPILRAVPGVGAVVPFSTGYARTESEAKPLKIIGLDAFAAPGLGISISAPGGRNGVLELLKDPLAIAVPQGLPPPRGGKIPVRINGRAVSLSVAADFLPAPGLPLDQAAVIADISSFQELFGAIGRVDSFEITADGSTSTEDLRTNIEQVLPPGVTIESTTDRAGSAQQITEAFRLNLRFLSLISLFVAALLIYNNTSAVVLRRRADFGVLLSLGLTPRSLYLLLLAENALLGIVGAIIGTGLGWFFSTAATSSVLDTIANLYLPQVERRAGFDPALLLHPLWIGPLVAVCGSVVPLLEIRRIPLRETFGYQTVETRFAKRVPILSICGLALTAAAAVLARLPAANLGPIYGFIPPLVLMAGSALLAPALTIFVVRISRILLGRGRPIETALASDHLMRTLRRNSVAVCSAMIALGMLWGLATMVRSFRDSVDSWISYITKADLYISSAAIVRGDQGVGIDPALAEQISRLPGVADSDSVRAIELKGRYAGVRLIASRFDLIDKHRRLLPIGSWLNPGPDRVFVSEPFANRFGVRAGDKIELPSPSGPRPVRIRGVYLDYSSDHGVITIPEEMFLSLYGDKPKSAISLYLNPGISTNDTAAKAAELDKTGELTIRNGAELRQNTLQVFDQTFRITDVLLAIALVVALFAIINAVFLSLAERRRELEILRAIGAPQTALLRTVALESLLLGISSTLGGVLFGGGMSLILVYVVNRRFFGWTTSYSVPAGFILAGAACTVLLALTIPLIPTRRFLRRLDQWDIRYE